MNASRLRGDRRVRPFRAAPHTLCAGALALLTAASICSPARAQERDWTRPDPQPAATASELAPPPASFASNNTPARTPIRRDTSSDPDAIERGSPGSLWGTLITLAAILGGLNAALRLIKRLSPAGVQRPSGSDITVLSSRRLDAQSAVHLVRIGSRVLAVGASPAGLTTLASITDPAEVAAFSGDNAGPPTAAATRPLFDGTRPLRRDGTSTPPLLQQPAGFAGGPHE